MRALSADDANAPPGQQLDQSGDVRLLARQRRQIKQHGSRIEERRRARDLRIQRRQPFRQWRLGREHERHERTASDSNGGTRLGN